MKTFTVHNVSPAEFQRLKTHLQDSLGFAFEEDGGKLQGEGSGISGSFGYDGQNLLLEIGSHAPCVTPGYLIGYVIDRLGEAHAPTAAGAAN